MGQQVQAEALRQGCSDDPQAQAGHPRLRQGPPHQRSRRRPQQPPQDDRSTRPRLSQRTSAHLHALSLLRGHQARSGASWLTPQNVRRADIDVLHCVREYVDGIARVHSKVRDLLAPRIKEAEGRYAEALRRWSVDGDDSDVGLAVTEQPDGADFPELSFHVSSRIVERRCELSGRNKSVAGLSKSFASTACKAAIKEMLPMRRRGSN